ncbi:MAG: CDP-diacylglycerol--glycerol-3-phosphate 3-phosphatidyltransferase, partial [uncultured Corynebacteriales bacterium]
ERRGAGPGRDAAADRPGRQHRQRADPAAAAAGAGLRLGAVAGGRDEHRLAGDRVRGVRGRLDHRPAGRRPGPPPRPRHRGRQAGRPDRRQGADRHRPGRAVRAGPAAVVGDDRDPGPRGRDHAAAVLGDPARGDPGQPRREVQDVPADHRDRALPAAAAGHAGHGGGLGDGGRGGADRGDRCRLRGPRARPAPRGHAPPV